MAHVDAGPGQLLALFEAARAAGDDATGVLAVWRDGLGEPVAHYDPDRDSWRFDALSPEQLPRAVYEAFKANLDVSLPYALGVIHDLGPEQSA